MKKILFSMFLLAGISLAAGAQTDAKMNDKKAKVEIDGHKGKVKKTSTPTQKVHNVVHPRNKKYSGVKVKGDAKKEG